MKRVVLIFGALIAAVWWFVLRVGPRRELPEGVVPVTAEGAIDHARKIASLDQVVHEDLVGTWAPTTATDVEVLVEGNAFYPRMLEDIASATGSIHVMQYGFQPGDVGDPFARAFAAKARDGVKVRLILDALGRYAFTNSKRMLADLAEAGVEIMLHDLIPPDRHGPIGQRRAMPHASQAGASSIASSSSSRQGGVHRRRRHRGPLRQRQVPRRLHPRDRSNHAPAPGPLRDRLPLSRRHDPARRPIAPGRRLHPRAREPQRHAAHELATRVAAIDRCRHRADESATPRLEITNPYIGDPGLIHAIAAVARRGAKVRLLVSDDAHGGIAYAAFQHHYDELLGAGVEIFEYPALVHAKVIVSDDRALVGTLNLDAWAMFRNPEHGLLFADKTIADRVSSTLVEPGIAASIRGEPTRSPLLRARNRVLAKASYLF